MCAQETATQPTTTTRTQQLPPYRVLLHNDDVNSFEHVILTILKLTPLKPEEAIERTQEAHDRGVSLLLVTHKERAELYVEQFATFKLTVTAEPDT
jgi:ATP-dependent Clp protease adaptor protein ClpS